MVVTYKQDLPPSGGYSKIDYAKRAPRPVFGVAFLWSAFIGYHVVSLSYHDWWKKNERFLRTELNEARIATSPFFLAERDRAYLKQLRSNRDEENDLMKNVPGWKTGTLFGEPVYHNLRERFIQPIVTEVTAHMSLCAKKQIYQDPKKRS